MCKPPPPYIIIIFTAKIVFASSAIIIRGGAKILFSLLFHTLSLSYTHKHIHTHTLTHPHSHTHTQTFSNTHTHAQTHALLNLLSVSLNPILSLLTFNSLCSSLEGIKTLFLNFLANERFKEFGINRFSKLETEVN